MRLYTGGSVANKYILYTAPCLYAYNARDRRTGQKFKPYRPRPK